MNVLQPNLVQLLPTAKPEGTAIEFPNLPGTIDRGDGGFAPALQGLLDHARERDVVAQQAVESFARVDDPGRIHETMVAVSKAEIALRTMASVRNKLIDAYRNLQQVTA